MIPKQATLVAIGVVSLILSGCAYKPLKAPCSPDEAGAPLAYAEPKPSPEPFRSLDGCGEMKPI
jgi:hypothetical protein